ncbi:unnamed protein product [Cuscuta epithymum]|uniref:Glutaredoxin domain-containing protein n=1 Tax=Cuscuta epithymum TaxID=186058 RepID=A0AAV0EIK5_9ASTE|nr:unnamed protein product [Cuscuta epithymum]CAH9130417.1 unnamed protein product [Cuscuta epithymum]
MNYSGTTSSDGTSNSSSGGSDYALVEAAELTRFGNFVSENAIIVFGRRGCCMSYVVRQLLLGLGANPTIYDVDEEEEVAVTYQLSRFISCTEDYTAQLPPPLPAVFIGGKFFGGLDNVMATHINGDLVPLLIKAGALWL